MYGRRCGILLLIALFCAGLSGCANLKLTGKSPTFGSAAAGGTTAAVPDPISDAGKPLAGSGDFKESASNSFEAQFALARLCERRGESDEAERIYHILLETYPNDARLHHRLGVLAVQKGDFAQAEGSFHKAQSLVPPSADLLSDLGYCFYLQHRLPEAEATFREALNLEPKHAATLNNLALVVGRQGRTQESLDLFKRTNSEAEAYSNLAYVMAQNGEYAEAEKMYLHALSLDNNMRAAAQAVLQINEREEASSRMKSKNIGPLAVAAPTNSPDDMSGQLVRLPKTEL
jgi:Flp pilus assembly protein TadD